MPLGSRHLMMETKRATTQPPWKCGTLDCEPDGSASKPREYAVNIISAQDSSRSEIS
eukprot:m.444572 g.444572  ORF g.444572 m.444572 type:complete len:57 (-) comp19113_c0_seq1:1464-1634(-)